MLQHGLTSLTRDVQFNQATAALAGACGADNSVTVGQVIDHYSGQL